jgi:hypothetical protein
VVAPVIGTERMELRDKALDRTNDVHWCGVLSW